MDRERRQKRDLKRMGSKKRNSDVNGFGKPIIIVIACVPKDSEIETERTSLAK